MSLRQFWRAALCYAFASGVIVPVALAGAEMAQAWDLGLTFGQLFTGLWLCCVGVPSLSWSTSKLSRVLGVRPVPMVKLGRWRSIPIGGSGHVLADAGRSVLWAVGGATRRGRPSIDLPDELTFVCDGHVFTEAEAVDFLRRAWSRQRTGKRGLSRSYWVDSRGWDRSRYDALTLTLTNLGLIVGRGVGASGKLTCPPLTAVNDLKHGLA